MFYDPSLGLESRVLLVRRILMLSYQPSRPPALERVMLHPHQLHISTSRELLARIHGGHVSQQGQDKDRKTLGEQPEAAWSSRQSARGESPIIFSHQGLKGKEPRRVPS